MFFIGFFVGWVIGILSALLLLCLIRRESEQVADGERVCCKENSVRWTETFYVEVATGKYHFAGDLIKEYGRQTLGKLVAEGEFVNEGHWKKMQEGKK